MANKRISALTALTSGDLATGDQIPLVDISASETKQITFTALEGALNMNNIKGTSAATGMTFGSLSVGTFSGASIGKDVQAYDADLLAIAALSGTGFGVKNGAGTWILRSLTAGTNIAITNPDGVSGNPIISNSASAGAPSEATYVVISGTGSLSAERSLTGTSNQITITDNGANSTVVISTPQNIATTSAPTFGTLTLTNISGTAVLSSDDTGTIRKLSIGSSLELATNSLNAIQDIRTTANVGFGSIRATNIAGNRIVISSGSMLIDSGALTNGQILIGSTSAAPVVAALTAGTNITVTNSAGGITISASGGGAGVNEQTTILTPALATLPGSVFGAPGRTVGTTFGSMSYDTLDFDAAAQEYCSFHIPIAPSATPATHKIALMWTADIGSGTTVWDIDWRSLSSGETIDATTTPGIVADTVTQSSSGTLLLNTTTLTMTTAGSAVAGDLLSIRLSRDAANAADTMSVDAKFIRALYEITD